MTSFPPKIKRTTIQLSGFLLSAQWQRFYGHFISWGL